MQNNYLEKLAYLQDNIRHIYDHYNIVYPERKEDRYIDLQNGYVLKIRESISSPSYTRILSSSLDKKDKTEEGIIVFEQHAYHNKIGEVNYGQTDYIRFISEQDFQIIFKEREIEKFILREAEKLKEKLDYDFSKDLPQRMIFQLPNDGCSIYVAKEDDIVDLKINFPKANKNGSNNFNANYDFRKIRDLFKVFDKMGFSCAFNKSLKEDKIQEAFLDFYTQINKIDSSLFKDDIKEVIDAFKEDLENVKEIITSLNFTNHKKLKI